MFWSAQILSFFSSIPSSSSTGFWLAHLAKNNEVNGSSFAAVTNDMQNDVDLKKEPFAGRESCCAKWVWVENVCLKNLGKWRNEQTGQVVKVEVDFFSQPQHPMICWMPTVSAPSWSSRWVWKSDQPERHRSTHPSEEPKPLGKALGLYQDIQTSYCPLHSTTYQAVQWQFVRWQAPQIQCPVASACCLPYFAIHPY